MMTSRFGSRKTRIGTRALPALAAALAAGLLAACDRGGSAFTREQYRAAATALHQQQLYREAVEVYEDYLRSPVIPAEDVPKVLFQMGSIWQENLMDPRQAFAKYALVKALYPGETFGGQLGKRMVACLEAMGRSVDATAARSRLTDIRPDSDPRGADSAAVPGAGSAAEAGDLAGDKRNFVVAELEGRRITLGEIASLVGKLPESSLETNQLAREYVAQILVAEAARRKGLADRPEVRLRIGQFENQILAQENLKEEIRVAPPTGNDLQYYFEANKARYQRTPEGAVDSSVTFAAAAQRVQSDWTREKQAGQYQAYVDRLLQTAQVRFYSAPQASAAGAAGAAPGIAGGAQAP
jgi:hypothetical protein